MSAIPSTAFKAPAGPTRRSIFERLCRDGRRADRVRIVWMLTRHARISQPAARARAPGAGRRHEMTDSITEVDFYCFESGSDALFRLIQPA